MSHFRPLSDDRTIMRAGVRAIKRGAAMTADRCHWVRDSDGLEVLIPHCWAAVLDPAACTCGVEGSRLEQAEAGRKVAEEEILRLREKLRLHAERHAAVMRHESRLYAEVKRLRDRVEELERRR
jgi:hypothetical protein